MSISNYIGQGIVFPVEINAQGGVDVETGFKLINSSIKNILMWPINRRIFLSEYGSPLSMLQEEPNDIILTSLIKNFIYNTLTTWEKRIRIIEIVVTKFSSSEITIALTYKLTKSNLEETFTFPFYRNIIY